ncbi:ABC transporter substrate-binding protein [Rhizomonospora bruguierae]|uniref:ABC transporter substrate-binding protein n=1 Tax=Rhizomonospora bruguierae TaxID=1581705 RepID=UPI001BCF6236|nr:ABC transporter substrate-binding protein [Micromonospora sp. NBRC 107566]
MHTTAPPGALAQSRRGRWQPLAAAVVVLAVLAAPAVVACSATPGQNAGHLVGKVTYLTAFGTFGREGFVYLARDKGYFTDNDLEVEVQPGSAGDTNLQLLAAGKAQFASIDYSGAVMRAGNNQFDEFVVVAALQANTMIALMAKDDGTIRTPRDLEGKTIGAAKGSVPEYMFPGYAKLAGINVDKVTFVNFAPQQLPSMLAGGKVDAIGQFVPGKPAITTAIAPHSVVILPYNTYMTDLYGNVLVTTKALLRKDPDLVQRFTRALLRGLTYAVQNDNTAAECGTATHKAVPATSLPCSEGNWLIEGDEGKVHLTCKDVIA